MQSVVDRNVVMQRIPVYCCNELTGDAALQPSDVATTEQHNLYCVGRDRNSSQLHDHQQSCCHSILSVLSSCPIT